MSTNYLKTYSLTLTTKTPLFVGSGREYAKREFIFDKNSKDVIFLNEQAWLTYLIDNGLVNAYEAFVFNNKSTLIDFIRDNNIASEDIERMTLYKVDSGDVDKSCGIKQFMRDARQRPYIPGSSLKGALRTALLWYFIADPSNKNSVCKMKRIVDEGLNRGRCKPQTASAEAELLNKLPINTKKSVDEVNSIMRCVSISDSDFLPLDAMMLARKYDVSTIGNAKSLNIARECIRPHATIHFVLTLDESYAQGLTIEDIQNAIKYYGTYYKINFDKKFEKPRPFMSQDYENCLVFGGGAGYFGKNITYALYGREEGLAKTAKVMSSKFKNHNHDVDEELEISPHVLKCTKYGGSYCPFGVCEVAMQEIG